VVHVAVRPQAAPRGVMMDVLPLSRVALGDRAAFATIYRATSAHLFGVILRIDSDRGQAEDILQEIYVSIWNAAKGFDPMRSQPMTWLTSIARHRAIDSLRRRKTEVSTVSSHVAVDGSDDEVDRLAELASDAAGPLELLQQAAQARSVTQCIDKLSAEQQQCVALAYYQGLSHAEVADHLAQPLGQDRRRVFRRRPDLCAARG